MCVRGRVRACVRVEDFFFLNREIPNRTRKYELNWGQKAARGRTTPPGDLNRLCFCFLAKEEKKKRGGTRREIHVADVSLATFLFFFFFVLDRRMSKDRPKRNIIHKRRDVSAARAASPLSSCALQVILLSVNKLVCVRVVPV